jgi:hypothetical protein
VVALDGSDDPEALARLGLGRIDLRTHAMSERLAPQPFEAIRVGPDGGFHVTGLRPGKVQIMLGSVPPIKGLTIVRMERDGVEQQNGIDVLDAENITGVRLIVAYGNGVIKGQLTADGGLPADMRYQVYAVRLGSRQPSGTAQVDARGRFVIEGLASGEYEVRAMAYVQAPPLPPTEGGPPPPSVMRGLSARQNVTVVSGKESLLTLELAPISSGDNR